jgi:hypothetical protein
MATKHKIICLILSLSVLCRFLQEYSVYARQEIPIVMPSQSVMLAGRFYFEDSIIATSGVVLDDSFCELTEIPPLPFDTSPHLEDGQLWASLKLPYKSENTDITNIQSFFGQFGQSKYSDHATVWGVVKDGSFLPKFTLPPWQTYAHGMTFKVTPMLPKMVDVEIFDYSSKTSLLGIKGLYAVRLPQAVAKQLIIYNSKLFDISSQTELCESDEYIIRNGYFVNKFAIVNIKDRKTADIRSLKLPGNFSIKNDGIEFYDKCGDCPNFDRLDKPTTIIKVGFDGKVVSQRSIKNIPNDWEVIDTQNLVLLCRSLKPPGTDFFVADESNGKVLHNYQASRENYPKARIARGVACVIDGGNMTTYEINSNMATIRQIGDKGTLFGKPDNLKAISLKGEEADIADANKAVLCGDIGKTRPIRHKGLPTVQFAEDGHVYSFYVQQASEENTYELLISYIKQKDGAITQGKRLFLPEWLTRFDNPEAYVLKDNILYYAQDYGKLCSINLQTFEQKKYDHVSIKYPQNFLGVAFVKLEGDKLYALYPGNNCILDCVDINIGSRIFSSFIQLKWILLLGANPSKPFIIQNENYILGPVRTVFNRTTGEVREYSGEFIGVDNEAVLFSGIGNEKNLDKEIIRLDLRTWEETRKSISRQDETQLAANSSKMAFGTVFKHTGDRIKVLPDCRQIIVQSGLLKNLSAPIGQSDSFFTVSNSTHLIKFEACPLFKVDVETNPDGKARIQFTPTQNGTTIPYGKIALVPLQIDDHQSLDINFRDVAWQTFNPLKTQKYEFANMKSGKFAFFAMTNAGFFSGGETPTIPVSSKGQAAFTMITFDLEQNKFKVVTPK